MKTSPRQLLAFDHPTYLRRMARELSHRPAGFYHGGQRWVLAKFSQGELRISRNTGWSRDAKGNEVEHRESRGFRDMTSVVFGDGNGGTICASRAAR